MSKEKAMAFLDQIETDSAFRKSLIEARNRKFGVDQTGTPVENDLIDLGFSVQDMHEAMYARGTKLSTSELQEITGGAKNIPVDNLEVIAFMHVYGVTKFTGAE